MSDATLQTSDSSARRDSIWHSEASGVDAATRTSSCQGGPRHTAALVEGIDPHAT